MRKVLLYLVVLAGCLSGYALADEPGLVTVTRLDVPSFAGYVEGELIVQFHELAAQSATASPVTGTAELGVASLDAIADRFGVYVVEPLFPGARAKAFGNRVLDLSTYHRIMFDKRIPLDDVLGAYRTDPEVASVEPIGIHAVLATPNDGYYVNQWHLNSSSDHDVDAPEAWNIETGDPAIIVAILDTGIRYFHKDLGGSNASYSTPTAVDGNMWVNWTEKNGTAGVDDDGNGYVDDWVGYDFVTGATPCWSGEDCSTIDNDPRDFNGHGTHCAGNVSAINNNGYATCATSGGWGSGSQQPTGNGVKAMACRIGWSGSYLGYEVGYVRMDFAASALYYAANKGARVASCSWGSSNTGGISTAIDYFLSHGGLIFKAAGNDGTQTADYMCGRTDILSVAATDANDCKADFSTYGTWVDVSAPGTGIYSSYHDHANPANDYVASMDGTSMATPIAASVAALIWSQHSDWTATQVKDRLLATADNINGLSCNSAYIGKLGSGRVNAYAAVNEGGCTAPVAAFVGSPTSGAAPLAVTFTDQSTGTPTSWSWTFGDGGTSTSQSPSHSYASAGTYSVTLTATNACGSDQEAKTGYITVTTSTQSCDDFADGSITNWVNKRGTWTATGGYMKGSSTTTDSRTTSPFGSFSAATIEADVRMNTGRTQRNARLVFAYVDGNNYRFVEGDDSNNRWRIYQRVGGSNSYVKSVSRTVNTAQWYHVKVVAAADGNVTLYVDGISIATYKFASAISGLVGCGYNKANSDFDNFCVGTGSARPADGRETPVLAAAMPGEVEIDWNYPNPFRESTTISFTLSEPAHVTLEIFDVLGRRVRLLKEEDSGAGRQTVAWNGRADSGEAAGAGVYFYRLSVNGEQTLRRMTLLH